jgi:hypothetical protein
LKKLLHLDFFDIQDSKAFGYEYRRVLDENISKMKSLVKIWQD